MSERTRNIEIFADWIGIDGLDGPAPLGTLRAQSMRGKELFSFQYNEAWLQKKDARGLDPALSLYRGPQYAGSDRPNFGLFLDSSPDRWGRALMLRREAILARREGRAPRRLGESDFLLGVHDQNRMGAL